MQAVVAAEAQAQWICLQLTVAHSHPYRYVSYSTALHVPVLPLLSNTEVLLFPIVAVVFLYTYSTSLAIALVWASTDRESWRISTL